jgi:hypothetical protein
MFTACLAQCEGCRQLLRTLAPSAPTEEGKLPAEAAFGLRLLSQDDNALGPADVDDAAVVTSDANSFARFVAVRDVADAEDGAGYELPRCMHAGGRVDDPLAGSEHNGDGVEDCTRTVETTSSAEARLRRPS